MAKFNQQPSMLFVVALIITILFALPSQSAIINQKPQQLLTKTNGTYLALSWGDIWNRLHRRKVPGGGRGPEVTICAIAPGRLDSTKLGIQEIWSNQPLFLWNIKRGTVKQVELLNKESEQIFWSQKIPTGQTKVIYDGKPLQPGQSYIWHLSHSPTSENGYYQFKIMDVQKRDRITMELAQLEKQLQKQGVSVEKIALEKANYFAHQELWSDALREIYSIPNPSAELAQMIEKISSPNYCQEAKTTQNTFTKVF
jgi:hypothetical protein